MVHGISLQDLAKKIEANRDLKRDLIADTATLEAQVDSDGEIAIQVDGQGRFPILPLAHDQIGARLQIPAKYYDRMKEDAPDLLTTNINTWFREEPGRRMLRTLGGDLRAFLSSRYLRTENEEIAAVALPILADLPNVQVPSCEVTDRRLYIHFVVPGIQGEVKVGDVVQAGGIITNSEVGCGAVTVSGLLWRLVCKNGMKTGDAYRRAHIGREAEDNGELEWADDTRRSDDQTVLLKVRDMVRGVVDETRFRSQIDRLKELAGIKVIGNPAKAVEVLAAKIGASETESAGILRALIEGGDLSAWAMVNAVTTQAHVARDYDRAVELEGAGGTLVEMPAAPGTVAVVTNPPFVLAAEFVTHGLKLVPLVIVLERIQFLESRVEFWAAGKLARIWFFQNRVPRMHKVGWTGKRASAGMSLAWFVFKRDHDGSAPRLDWIRWGRS
jgi:hypothetical protein